MSEFGQAVADALHALLASGVLVVESSTDDPQPFGNAVVLLRGANVRLRFVRDRGQEFVELACAARPEDWHLLQRVLTALGVAAPPEGPLGVDEAAGLLTRHATQIDAELCAPDTAAKLAALGAAATRALLNRLKGGTN